ncbi:MAG: prephenate dehydratase, partial [Actinomycetota bacterium]|nr:prephenate dehydratase [Actinomycetota bacterium]
RGVDLTRIESRPIKERHGEYWFHLDCAGHVAEPAMGEALTALHRRCTRVRYLGSYPRADVAGTASGTSDPDATAAEPVNGNGNDRFVAAAAWLARVRSGDSA